MPEIKVLPQEVADKIAAGEVAERPSAVVKELVENAMDAGATSIEVEIRKGGIEYIRICDNGCGMEPEQTDIAFMRHATSKLRNIEDLYSIGTMGFRGEALSSICAVADVTLITRTANNEEGVILHLDHGIAGTKEPVAAPVGTTMIVERLFENVPARMKFLKKDSTEAGYVADVLGRIALSAPHIAFSYICDDKEVFSTSGDGNLKNTVLKLYGLDHARAVIPVEYTEDNVTIRGLVGKPEISRGNRTRQTLFVNGRYIKSHVVSKIVGEAYRNSIMVGKFPFFVLNICIPPDCVDVNVHPAKTEIKFANENRVYDIIYHGVSNAIKGGTQDNEQHIQKEKIRKEDIDVKENAEKSVQYTKNTVIGEKTKTVFGTGYVFERNEKADRQLVREYMDSVMPKREEPPVKEEKGMIFKEFNFLEEDTGTVREVREIDLPPSENEEKVVEDISYHKEPIVVPTPIGQVFDTYIMCQTEDDFYMIDQHAAHERLRFESLKSSYYKNERMSQMLLSPMIFRPDYGELQTILSNIDAYKKFGFEIEDFGSGSIIVNATPIIADEAAIRDLILEIADALSDTGRHTVADFEERALDMIACKYAIKANHKLNIAEMRDLTEKVWDMAQNGIKTCPHGRPITVEFSKSDIEKMFKRKL